MISSGCRNSHIYLHPKSSNKAAYVRGGRRHTDNMSGLARPIAITFKGSPRPQHQMGTPDLYLNPFHIVLSSMCYVDCSSWDSKLRFRLGRVLLSLFTNSKEPFVLSIPKLSFVQEYGVCLDIFRNDRGESLQILALETTNNYQSHNLTLFEHCDGPVNLFKLSKTWKRFPLPRFHHFSISSFTFMSIPQ